MKGTNDSSNIIELTIEEHAEAHYLLYLKYSKWQDKIAWLCLSGQITNAEANHMTLVESGKLNVGSNNPMFGKHHTETTKQKMRKPKSKEAKEKMRLAKLGKSQSQNHIKKRMQSMKSIYNSKSYKKKISQANKGKRAIPITINGITYKTKTEARKKLKIRYTKLKQLID